MRETLTTDIRDVVGLLFSEGKSLEEISLVLSIPVGKGNERGTAKDRFHVVSIHGPDGAGKYK